MLWKEVPVAAGNWKKHHLIYGKLKYTAASHCFFLKIEGLYSWQGLIYIKGGLKVVKAVYPGSFDPVTKGHLDIIERASKVFDRLIVAVLENPRKNALFSMEERVKMLEETTSSYGNVDVDYYQGLLVEYAENNSLAIIVKGLRAISDFEFEFQMALINKKLNRNVDTMFMMTDYKYSFISSSLVKEVASYGGDISELVPPQVYEIIINKIENLK